MKSFARRQLTTTRQRIVFTAIAALLVASAGAHAESVDQTKPTVHTKPSASAEPVTDTMHKLASDVQVLLPLIYQYEKPATLIDKQLIEKQIGNLQAHLDKLATSVAPRADTYQISYQALALQLQQAQQEFARDHDAYGMSLLRSATSVCATCHTQDDRHTSWLMPASDALNDAFVAGEFFFMTRQYDRAFDAYRNWLRQQQPLRSDQRTQTAFERLLLTALQMQKSPKAITELLTEFTQRDDINGALKKKLDAWRSGVATLQQQTDIAEHPAPATLKRMATQWLGSGESEPLGPIILPETQRPQIVWLRGELYRALINETDRSMIADWLYWLALSDRVLEYRFYYSLTDMYLKQCMLEYTQDPIAQSCYREYENYVTFSYTGSSGTHIPADVQAELKTLKRKVFP